MMLAIPAAKCVVIADASDIDNNVSTGKTGKTHANSKNNYRAIILTMPDGKEIRLLLKNCTLGEARLELPDES